MGCFACFDGGKQQRKEEERQEQFDQSAAGKAARAQLAAAAKQSANSNKGEPVLKTTKSSSHIHDRFFKMMYTVAESKHWHNNLIMFFPFSCVAAHSTSNKAFDACAVFHTVETDVRDRICSWAGVHSSPSNRDVVKLGTFD
ncbi:hypothetical protein TEA_013798 [Camellia sinensis var. sinensis]|uniref:Uncharacterized protein n=1 Tax=Camellia sinensis var. sinensis TaxID=542762 RepID=A0A4S4E0R2_CAMSN|nr:hypothetical protein TEA_013798 [Camellia sinensis var. sinensis]